MMKKNLFIAIIGMIFIFSFMACVQASFELGNVSENIQSSYIINENIKGWINISLDNEKVNNLITCENFEGNISIIDLLKNNSVSYSCSPNDCKYGYSSSNPETSKSFFLNSNEEKIISLKTNGNDVEITNLKFNITASNDKSCLNPLKIDFLNNDNIDWQANKVVDDFSCTYEGGYGCYDKNSDFELKKISDSRPYCEKIKLPPSEKFELGAWISGAGTWSDGDLKMYLYDLNNNEVKNCNLPQPSNTGSEISCHIEYSNKELKEYYICVKATTDIGDYNIKMEKNTTDACGFYAFPGQQTSNYDYHIFARGAKFSNIGEVEIKDLKQKANTYLQNNYGKDCSDGCSIPIKIKAYQDMDITLHDLKLEYSSDSGSTTNDEFYDTSTTEAVVSSNFVKLDLSYSNIKVPSSSGDKILKLNLGDRLILEKNISVLEGPEIESLSPLNVPAGSLTEFEVEVYNVGNRSIETYNWYFGDGTNKTTTNERTKHKYSSIKEYNLKIEIIDNAGVKVERTFKVNSVNPKNYINLTIEQYKNNLDEIDNKIENLSQWQKDLIKEKINVDGLNEKIKSLKRNYNSASTNEEYIDIMSNLTELKVPSNLRIDSFEDISYFIDYKDISPEILSDLNAGSYESVNKENYQKSIAVWIQNNLNLKISSNYVIAYYNQEREVIASLFNLEISPNESSGEKIYLVIEGTNFKFDKNYNQQEVSGYIGMSFEDNKYREIGFGYLGDISLNEINIFISPEFSKLEIIKIEPCDFDGVCEKELGENWRNCRSDCKPWGFVAVLLIILIFAALIIYILLQWWYKKKYESYLFKNKNDLYNILNFISNAKSQGLSFKEIVSKLKKAGWSGEQISYAFKKMRGKAIMPFDFLKLFKKFGKIRLKKGQPTGIESKRTIPENYKIKSL